MGGPVWGDDEATDALALGWGDFHPKWPHRSHSAWRQYRDGIRRGEIERPREKVAPVTEGLPESEEEARELLARSDDDIFEALIAWQKAVVKTFPMQRAIHVSLPVDTPIGLCLMSDWHIGAEGTDLDRLWADVQLIASHPLLYVGLGGDVVDNFILEKMASAARSSVATVQVQWRGFRKAVRPLIESHSLLWVSSGNHDQWTEKVAAIDPILAALAEVPIVNIAHRKEGGYVDLDVGAQRYTIWRKHRPSGMTSRFNVNHYLKQQMRVELPREYDIGVSEHIHTPETATWHYRETPRALCALGSYKVNDQHARDWGFYNGGYGVPCVVLYPDRRRMVAFDCMADAVDFLDGTAVPLGRGSVRAKKGA